MSDKTSRGAEPQGIIMLAVAKDNGRVIAAATDFHADRYGGFSKKEAQSVRARQRLYGEIVKQCCSPLIYKNVSAYTIEKIVQDLLLTEQIELWTHEVGHDEA